MKRVEYHVGKVYQDVPKGTNPIDIYDSGPFKSLAEARKKAKSIGWPMVAIKLTYEADPSGKEPK